MFVNVWKCLKMSKNDLHVLKQTCVLIYFRLSFNGSMGQQLLFQFRPTQAHVPCLLYVKYKLSKQERAVIWRYVRQYTTILKCVIILTETVVVCEVTWQWFLLMQCYCFISFWFTCLCLKNRVNCKTLSIFSYIC